MSHINHFLKQVNEAIDQGFDNHFQILPCGLIRCINSGKEYSVEQVLIVVESCVDCRTTFYCIDAQDKRKGTAVEHWDV
jgi:predicted nucleotide-binding protein (sugar kinase/HSP70/actin superfamily)